MDLQISHEAREVHAASLIVDLHCDLLLTSYFLGWDWTKRHRPNPLPGAALMGHGDIPRFREGNFGCLALGMVINPMRRGSGPDAIRADFDRLDALLAQAPGDLALAGTAEQIAAARTLGKIAVFAGLEGAHGLNGRVEDLPEFKARGLGYVGLAHFNKNAACRPMVGWGSSQTEGLSDYGRLLVDELNRLDILVDVAHVNKPGVLEVCARTKVPIICSHTACNAVHSSPRGLDDEQILAIARTGGVVGIIFVTPFIGPGGVEAVCDHMDHVRKVVGVDHVAIGTDWDGWSLYPRDLDSADKMPILTDALLRRGWTPQEILKVYGDNFMRVLRDAVGA